MQAGDLILDSRPVAAKDYQKTTGKTTAKTPFVLTETEEKIIIAMRENPKIMQVELARQVNIELRRFHSLWQLTGSYIGII